MFAFGFVKLRDDFQTLIGNVSYLLAFVVFPSIVIIFERNKERIILNNRINNTFGKCSFYYFLFHMPVFACLAVLNSMYDIKYNWSIAVVLAIIVSVAAYCVANIRQAYKEKNCE